jgi:hypothetical protein
VGALLCQQGARPPACAMTGSTSTPSGCCSCYDTGTSSSTWPRPTCPPSTTTSGRGFSPPEYHPKHCPSSAQQHRLSTARHRAAPSPQVLCEFDEFSHGDAELRKWGKGEIPVTQFEVGDEIMSRSKRRSRRTHLWPHQS